MFLGMGWARYMALAWFNLKKLKLPLKKINCSLGASMNSVNFRCHYDLSEIGSHMTHVTNLTHKQKHINMALVIPAELSLKQNITSLIMTLIYAGSLKYFFLTWRLIKRQKFLYCSQLYPSFFLHKPRENEKMKLK